MTALTPTENTPTEHEHSAPAKLGYSPVAEIPHRLRVTDTDPKAARRAERQVASKDQWGQRCREKSSAGQAGVQHRLA